MEKKTGSSQKIQTANEKMCNLITKWSNPSTNHSKYPFCYH